MGGLFYFSWSRRRPFFTRMSLSLFVKFERSSFQIVVELETRYSNQLTFFWWRKKSDALSILAEASAFLEMQSNFLAAAFLQPFPKWQRDIIREELKVSGLGTDYFFSGFGAQMFWLSVNSGSPSTFSRVIHTKRICRLILTCAQAFSNSIIVKCV